MKNAVIDKKLCVACGCCQKVCPRSAVTIRHGVYAEVDRKLCVGCGICQKACPASVITMEVNV